MYCPITLQIGSEKALVADATRQKSYHPLYLSLGNFHNTARDAHTVVLIGFIAVPEGMSVWKCIWFHLDAETQLRGDLGHASGSEYSTEFRVFKQRLFHISLETILSTLLPGMTTPVIRRCPDRHFRRVIYDLIAFTTDYPEQLILTSTAPGWCPK